MLKAGLTWYPKAEHFYLVSGDSVPVKHPQAAATGGSITGATSFGALPEYQASGYDGWYTGHQWTMLTRSDATRVVEKWQEKESYFLAEHMRHWNQEHNHPEDCPDSEYIPTILHGMCDIAVRPGETIMEEVVESSQPTPCGCRRGQSAHLFGDREWGQLERLLDGTASDKVTFAFRKVGSDVDTDKLLSKLTGLWKL